MPIASLTLTGNVNDLIGDIVDTRRTKVWIVARDANGIIDRIADPESNQERFGNASATVAQSGIYTFTDLWPTNAATSPTDYYYEIVVDYPLARGVGGNRGNGGRDLWRSGPFELTASANVADLDLDIPAITATWRSAFRDDMEDLRDQAAASAALADQYIVADLNTSDGQMEALTKSPTSLTGKALRDAFSTLPGANLARFIDRARSGENVKIVAIGDSILEGTTVTADGGALGIDDTLPRVANSLASRFGISVTTANHAKSGHTVAIGPLSLLWTDAVAEKGDLYLIDYGTNDLSADLTSVPVPGYKMADAMAGLERLFRRIRSEVPRADIAFLIANPYNGGVGSGNNPAKVAWNKRVRGVCAYYGVEVIDGFQAFADVPGGYASLMADTTHPNTAGHTLLAATVMKHLPSNFRGPSVGPAVVPVKGLYNAEDYDPAVGDTGALSLLVPTAPMWAETGAGWSTSGSARVSSTVGNTITGTGNFTELYVMISTLTADGFRATLTVDGLTRFTNADFTTGKQGTYWVPIATDLPAGDHTYVLTITAGTAKISRVGWLSGPVAIYNTNHNWQDIAGGTTATAIPDTGSVLYLAPSSSVSRVTWPTGWRSAKIDFSGYVNARISATTTTARRLQIRVMLNNVAIATHQSELLAAGGGTYFPSIAISSPAVDITANRLVSVEASIISTDKTSCQVLTWAVQAHLTRLT